MFFGNDSFLDMSPPTSTDSTDAKARPETLFSSHSIRRFQKCQNSGISDRGVAWDPPIHATMLATDRYKLNIYHGEEIGELYDRRQDPREQHNLWESSDHADIRAALLKRLADWFAAEDLAHGERGGSAPPKPGERLVNALKE